MVLFEDVWLRYRQAAHPGAGSPEVLRGISFEIPEGGMRWLTGPSGAGKTSLLKLIYLSEHPARGHIEVLGTPVARVTRNQASLLRRRIGVVYQDFRLLPQLNAYDNIALPMRLAHRPETSIHADVIEIMKWVGLSHRHQALPFELSGGEQQRIAIARAVVSRPKLLIADEPTGNLDDDQAQRVMLLLTALNKLGTTVIVATHNTALIQRHPAPALRIESGRLVQDG
ncbi:cell division ATP-binding protein FtsE [Acidocella sp.]|uniref:cell division ATP-binding protein FtsE n=1 Tax=Acidocella sp. TaxID=50710 RepID=UPI0038D0047C